MAEKKKGRSDDFDERVMLIGSKKWTDQRSNYKAKETEQIPLQPAVQVSRYAGNEDGAEREKTKKKLRVYLIRIRIHCSGLHSNTCANETASSAPHWVPSRLARDTISELWTKTFSETVCIMSKTHQLLLIADRRLDIWGVSAGQTSKGRRVVRRHGTVAWSKVSEGIGGSGGVGYLFIDANGPDYQISVSSDYAWCVCQV